MIFTSHDRHFMHRVATHVIEVRDGRVASYPASYDDYVYRMQKEIDAGLRAPHTVATPGNVPAAAPAAERKPTAAPTATPRRSSNRSSAKSPSSTMKRRPLAAALLTVTDAAEAQRLHAELAKLTAELATLEEEWLALSEAASDD